MSQDPFIVNIEEETLDNDDYRKVMYTTENSQMVYMSVAKGGQIHMEKHDGATQFLRIESGQGLITFVLKRKRSSTVQIPFMERVDYIIGDGTGIMVPPNTYHRIVNDGSTPLKLYTLYSPPQHGPHVVQHTEPASSNIYDFVDSEYLNHLTMGDIRKWKPGHKLEVVMWDRNFDDIIYSNNVEKRKVYPAEEMFSWSKVTLTYLGSNNTSNKNAMFWRLGGSPYDDPKNYATEIEVDVSPYQTGWEWAPLNEKGDLVIKSPSHNIFTPNSELPDTMRVGFRGPMMPWHLLKNKTVFWDDPGAED